MSKKEGKKFIIEVEMPQQCDICGKIAELRPYGPNGECICFGCGMKDKKGTTKQFLKALGNSEDVELHI